VFVKKKINNLRRKNKIIYKIRNMQYKENYNTLVIAGLWNIAIFTPEWVAKYLLPNTQLNVEFPINMIGSLKFSTDELSIFIVEGKLNLAINKHSDDVLIKIGELANQLADYLPHTPVTAFGLNYIYENEFDSKINSCLTINDNEKFGGLGLVVESTSIIRKFNKENCTLTLTVNKVENKFIFNLNYNFPIRTLAEFKEKFEPKALLNFKKDSLEILEKLYGLKLL